jgi:hypothetical protein
VSAGQGAFVSKESFGGARGARVFGVSAYALPLPEAVDLTLRGRVEVALLAPPSGSGPFPIRVPRGTVDIGALFIVRCANGRETQLALVRALGIIEPLGVGFDLIHARVETPAADVDPLEKQETTDNADNPRPARGRGRPREGSTPQAVAHGHVRGCASAVSGLGVATVSMDTTVTVLTPVAMGVGLRLSAPRGHIEPGVYFALRYFDASGAKRGVVRADGVHARPGMLDEIEAVLIGAPIPAPERQSYRAPFDLYFTATIDTRARRRVVGRMIDISGDGLGFRINATLEPNERLCIADPSLPHLDGAELVIVRSDPRDPHRHGARFSIPDRGAEILATMLGLDRAERAHRRRVHIDAIRKAGGGTAEPVTETEVRQFLRRGMSTRIRVYGRERTLPAGPA